MKYFQPPIFRDYQICGFFSEKIAKERIPDFKKWIVFPEQIHSDIVILLTDPSPPEHLKADGLISFSKDLSIGVQTADCLPIMLADRKKRLVGVVHAGWRGTIKGVLLRAIEQIVDLGIYPEDLLIAIGPHIQVTCYEVGSDLIDLLPPGLRKPPFLIGKKDHYYLNLSQINLSILHHFKIPEKNIWISSECTHCLSYKYHSYRREKNYFFTQISVISLNSDLVQKLNEIHL